MEFVRVVVVVVEEELGTTDRFQLCVTGVDELIAM